MKFDINAKELLALHDMLQLHLTNSFSDDVADRSQLRQLHDRIRACIIGALSKTSSGERGDKFEAYLEKQEAMIRELEELPGMHDVKHDSDKMEPDDWKLACDVVDDPEYPRRMHRRGPRKAQKLGRH